MSTGEFTYKQGARDLHQIGRVIGQLITTQDTRYFTLAEALGKRSAQRREVSKPYRHGYIDATQTQVGASLLEDWNILRSVIVRSQRRGI